MKVDFFIRNCKLVITNFIHQVFLAIVHLRLLKMIYNQAQESTLFRIKNYVFNPIEWIVSTYWNIHYIQFTCIFLFGFLFMCSILESKPVPFSILDFWYLILQQPFPHVFIEQSFALKSFSPGSDAFTIDHVIFQDR